MNGNDSFLIDTNIIIYSTQDVLNINDFVKDEDDLYISSITYIETMGFQFQDKEEEEKVAMLCESFERIFLTKEIEKQTIRIRKANKIKLPDAIIAATAIVYNLTLVTHNIDDFKNIQGLKILNPL
jgi:predicted nucleic acid-binding protein